VSKAAGEIEITQENIYVWLEMKETLDFSFRQKKKLLQ
jgi:hypothetical protein